MALSACASYRALPLEPPAPGQSPLALRYERTRFHLFTSTGDAEVEKVFASGTTIVATVSQPGAGVFVSTDSGTAWTFAPLDDASRDVMFDGPFIVARGAAAIHCSGDGGKTWQHHKPANAAIDAAAAADGAIYVAAGNHLHLSRDCARTWDTLTPQIQGGWRARSIAVDRRNVYLSVRGVREAAPALATLLDGSSGPAAAALAIADGQRTQWPGTDGIWVTHDGGTLWQKSSLPLDAWLAVVAREVWAIAADPMIEGAALVRRSPVLAAALDGQIRGARPDAKTLRASLRFPGRDDLLRDIPAPIFRSLDEGGTWMRMDRAPAALRLALERQRKAQPAFETVAQAAPNPRSAAAPPSGGSRRGRGRRGDGGRGAERPLPQRSARAISSEQFFVLLDPVRLLTRFNSGRSLTSIAGDGVLYAYAPTQQFWDSLADAAAAAADAEGEIAADSAAPPRLAPDGFELLSSMDGGATWSTLPTPRLDAGSSELDILPYPVAVAGADSQALFVFAAAARGGKPWREAWREVRE
ncbi:MAG TPA: hypothetical protein VFA79_06220 [Myxococcales bacterium]|nr:hypothetical protein [Myxococcales bacterium]